MYIAFPEFEETLPPTGAGTQRSNYYLAGQLMAVWVRTGTTGSGALYYAYSDHLGSVVAWANASGALVSGSLARYEPYGGYRTKPPATVNPDISDRGFTGHRQNNSGTYDFGLVYMNARYYLPEVGRFISADTIVPEPKDPQSYNRYSYANNSPLNFTDPTGHCINNYEIGSDDMDTCIAGWNAVVNYLAEAAYGPGGSGEFPNATVADWLMNAEISTLEKLMASYGIGYGYTWTPPQGYSMSGWRGGTDLKSPAVRAGVCQYWQGCYEPMVTGDEMRPDAFIAGVSGSAAGVVYSTVGIERVVNLHKNQRSVYVYHGQGAGVAL